MDEDVSGKVAVTFDPDLTGVGFAYASEFHRIS